MNLTNAPLSFCRALANPDNNLTCLNRGGVLTMLNLKNLLLYLFLIPFLSLFIEGQSVRAQRLRLIYDGRTETVPPTASDSEVQFVRRYALPKARRFWHDHGGCVEEFDVIDATSGSFTKPGVAQRAVLYSFCTYGYNFAHNGIVIIEGRRIVAHVLYEGAADSSIKALADLNRNGIFEIMLGDYATHQGYNLAFASLIEISPSSVKKFGITALYEDNCGTVESREQCKMITYKILANRGRVPIFYRETYRQRNESWIKVGNSMRYALKRNNITYNLVK